MTVTPPLPLVPPLLLPEPSLEFAPLEPKLLPQPGAGGSTSA